MEAWGDRRRLLNPQSALQTHWSLRNFEVLLAFSQLFGFAAVILSGFYFGTVEGGLRWQTKSTAGNHGFHGLLMVFGMVFFQGEALLSYRLYRHEVKVLSKMVHGICHTIAIGMITFSLVAVINGKNMLNMQHFYSFHSWIGAAIVFAYLVQYFFGLLTFTIFPTSQTLRAYFLPIHRTAGSILFGASVAQVILGFNLFSVFWAPEKSYSGDPERCSHYLNCPSHLEIILNFALISIVLYAITVFVLIFTEDWKREKTPDEK